MCGIAGFWDFKAHSNKERLMKTVQDMCKLIEHRGPDSAGFWCDERVGLALGHQRLSIVDRSETGHQPMISSSSCSIIIYNGELYNTEELRSDLLKQGCQFRGTSDTEVLLLACELWGVLEACKRINGMFAFAYWDQESQSLTLARDRIGKKPLYWGFNKGILYFGSQLKSFKAHPEFKPEIDKQALMSLFRYNYIPSPLSVFQGIHKLTPGTLTTIKNPDHIKETTYWSFRDVVNHKQSLKKSSGHAKASLSVSNEQSWITELDVLLRDAVKRRMIAEVPLGAFLSGGIDSSTIVALMQAESHQPVKTFSIGFHEQAYNEAPYAASVAKHLGTEHHELYIEPKQALDIIPSIPEWCDEPFADPSQIPTYLVSHLAKKYVTVSLSGDGGDELFAGYNRYFLGKSIWNRCQWAPFWLRKSGETAIRMLSPNAWEKVLRYFPMKNRPILIGDKLYKLADVLSSKTGAQFYQKLVTLWEDPEALVKHSQGCEVGAWAESNPTDSLSFVEAMQYWDTLTYLPDDILTKVDRASMAVSLEARAPLLDYRVIEFAWGLPEEMKIRNGQGKWILRQVLNKYVPSALIDRTKMGFGVPIDSWLRGPLRPWAEDLLSEEALQRNDLLNPEPIQKRFQEHLSGTRNWQYPLWGILMFQAWRQQWDM